MFEVRKAIDSSGRISETDINYLTLQWLRLQFQATSERLWTKTLISYSLKRRGEFFTLEYAAQSYVSSNANIFHGALHAYFCVVSLGNILSFFILGLMKMRPIGRIAAFPSFLENCHSKKKEWTLACLCKHFFSIEFSHMRYLDIFKKSLKMFQNNA